jgi:hypothetical protein
MWYICTVNKMAQDNYDLGLLNRCWGVVERYEGKISRVRAGDSLIFILDGKFRSIHRIESDPFEDHTPIWLPKDGSLFPHRVRISKPLFTGEVPVAELAGSISFMAGRRWSGTIQGPHGVFNPKATKADYQLISSKLQPVIQGPQNAPPHAHSPRIEETLVISWNEARLRSELESALAKIDLSPAPELTQMLAGAVNPDPEALTGVFTRGSGYFVVDFHRGEPPEHKLMDLLRRMSWVRQHLDGRSPVEGLLVAEEPGEGIIGMIESISNVSARRWRIGLVLDPDPITGMRRRAA